MDWKKILTKEYLIEHTELTEEDLKGVNVEDFIDYGPFSEGLGNYPIKKWLTNYKNHLAEMDHMENYHTYSPLFEKYDRKLQAKDIEHVVCIGYQTWRSAADVYIFDLATNLAYLQLGEKNEITFLLPNEAVEVLQKGIQDCGILSIPDTYLGAKGIMGASAEGGSFYWSLFFELDDGTVAAYHGDYEEMPTEVSAFCDVMRIYWLQALETDK